MRLLIPMTLFCALLLTLAPAADAQQCHRVTVQPVGTYGHAVYQQTYYPAVVTEIFPVFIPAVSVGYAGDAGVEKQLLQLKVELLQTQLQMQKLAPGALPPGAGPTMPQADAQGQPVADGNLTALVTANCASCHAQGRAKASGNGVVLLPGGSAEGLSPQQRLAVAKQLSLGLMPKGKKLDDQTYEKFMKAL